MRAIVTGAAGGIGRAIAARLALDARAAGEPAQLLLVDLNATVLDEVIASFDARVEASALKGDLSSKQIGDEVVTAARERFGGIDLLISNAGVLHTAPLEELGVDDWDLAFAVNTRATWLLARAAYPFLRESAGAIVATGSISADEPTPPNGAYSASKAALIMLVRQLAAEWGPAGIRCNCVSPGLVRTPMTAAAYEDERSLAWRTSHVPLRRIATPEEIADVVAFLAGPDSRYVNGANLVVDGGLQTGLMPAVRRVPEGFDGRT
jgi:NAD(P)-dependent dehydrogenase (short-subunit alcohol dehydrogenase family)